MCVCVCACMCDRSYGRGNARRGAEGVCGGGGDGMMDDGVMGW